MSKIIFLLTILLTSPAWATDYYFAPEGIGSDSNAGTFASPWLSVAKMNTITGKNRILLREGGVWNSNAEWGGATQLLVGMSGTGDADADRAIIGMYLAATGVRATKADVDNGATRPIITGDNPSRKWFIQ